MQVKPLTLLWISSKRQYFQYFELKSELCCYPPQNGTDPPDKQTTTETITTHAHSSYETTQSFHSSSSPSSTLPQHETTASGGETTPQRDPCPSSNSPSEVSIIFITYVYMAIVLESVSYFIKTKSYLNKQATKHEIKTKLFAIKKYMYIYHYFSELEVY